ncbi:MAG: hypothetical protein RLZZ612_683, partial [Pseudomonadota bacterium]
MVALLSVLTYEGVLMNHPSARPIEARASSRLRRLRTSASPAPHPLLGAVAHSPAAQGHPLRALVWALATAFMSLPATTAAQPSGAQAVAGQVSVQQQGQNLLVHTQNAPGTKHSTINWQSFSVPAGSRTWVQQPDAVSTSINRVVTSNPSQIMGTLGSNGHIVLVNPSGITVGKNAVVDTARFTAAAMQMTETDAKAARLRFEGGSHLNVEGHIKAGLGDVVLLAPQAAVDAGAIVQAPNGAVLLAAGQKVELVAPGLSGLRFEVQAPSDRAVNLGLLQGSAVGMFAAHLRHSGQIEVQAVREADGRVVLKAKDQADIDGTARAQRLNRLGGLFHATAQTVNVGGTAKVDASGAAGGGEVLIGGGWQGKDARLSNAQTTTIARGAVLDASATERGAGGTVVAWADGNTTFHGHILARGGTQSGDGGQVETSGKDTLDARGGRVDTRAPQGKTGRWLLDPSAITIEGGCAPGPTPCPPAGGPAPAPAATVYEADLEVATTDVTLQADQQIAVNGTFSGNKIALPAHISITLETTGTGGPGINLLSGGIQPIGIETSGTGSIMLRTLDSNGDIMLGYVSAPGASPALVASGSGGITLDAQKGAIAIAKAGIQTAGGNISIRAGNVAASGTTGIEMNASSVNAGTGTATIEGFSTGGHGVQFIGNNTLSSSNTTLKGETSGSATHGVAVIGASTVVSGAGPLSVTGKNTSAGAGIQVSGAGAQIQRTDALTLDGTGYGGYGVQIVDGGVVTSNTANVTITGSSDSTIGVKIASTPPAPVSSVTGGHVTVHGITNASTSSGVYLGRGHINGTGTILIDASTGKSILIDTGSSVAKTGAGDLALVADQIEINGTVSAAATNARVVLRPLTHTQLIQLGQPDSPSSLGLEDAELKRITTPTIVVGWGTHTGGISVESAIAPTNAPDLSLITNAPITQTASGQITATGLNADGTLVALNHPSATHSVSKLAGHSRSGQFSFKNGADLEIGQVDGQNGIDAYGNNVSITNAGGITQTQLVKNTQQWSSTSNGGLNLGQAGNQIGEFLSVTNVSSGLVALHTTGPTVYTSVQNSGGGDVVIQTGTGNSADLVSVNSGSGRIQVTSGGAASITSLQSSATVEGGTASTASVAVSAQGAITHVTSPAPASIQTNGSVVLNTASGAIGSSSTNRVMISSTKGVIAQAGGAGSPINLGFGGNATVDKAIAEGSIDIAATAGQLQVRDTVASSNGNVRLTALNGIQVSPSGPFEAKVTASKAVHLSNTGSGDIAVLATSSGGARIEGGAADAAGCSTTDAVCLSNPSGAITATATGTQHAVIRATANNIALNATAMTLTGGTTSDAVLLASATGNITGVPGSCTGCNPLPHGVNSLVNTTPQTGLLAGNYYRSKVVTTPDSVVVPDTGGSINILSNDHIEGANSSTPVLIPATTATLTTILVSPPTGVTESGGVVSIANTAPSGSYNVTYTACSVLDPNNCTNGTLAITKNAPPPPAPVPPPPPPPAPVPPPPPPPAPVPPPPPPPAPVPPPPPPPAPGPPPPPP